MTSIEQTLAERGNCYGTFEDNAAVSQGLEDVLRATKGWARLTYRQKESLSMCVHKMSRIVNGDAYHEDSWRDIAGYATLAQHEAEEHNAVAKS